jgi:hypothetical protein
MDERVAERFDPAAGDVERLMYGFSVFHCLPGRHGGPALGRDGDVMRPGTLRAYASRRASASRNPPLKNPFFNFYRLVG